MATETEITVRLTESESASTEDILLGAADHFTDQAGDAESDNEPEVAESWRDLAETAQHLLTKVNEAMDVTVGKATT